MNAVVKNIVLSVYFVNIFKPINPERNCCGNVA